MKKLFYSQVLLCLSIFLLMSLRLHSAELLGQWLFEEGAGKKVEDSSGQGNDGELIGKPKWVDGKFGKALEFDGDGAGTAAEAATPYAARPVTTAGMSTSTTSVPGPGTAVDLI